MTTDEKILKTLEDLQAGQNTLKADIKTLNGKVDNLEGEVKSLHTKVDNVELKSEAIHVYQKKAHTEIMEHLIDSNEINGQEQEELEKRIARIEKHLGLPQLK